MSMIDGVLSKVAGTASVQGLAAKVGLSPEQVEQAVAALSQAHHSEGDTVATASQQTGLPHDKLNQIVGHLGGENALGPIGSMLGGGGAMGGLGKFL